VTEESLAFEVIREVVGEGGDFLSHPHTIEHFRRELSESDLLLRVRREIWMQQGGLSFTQRARQKLSDLLRQQKPSLLTDQQLKDLRKLERRRLNELCVES
jgi:trimethylamine--corrinoid protein Co-methyltransferase